MRRKFVLLALRYPNLRLLLLRRTLPELRENHVMPLLMEIGSIAKYNDTEKTFTFPNGSRLVLGYCDAEIDARRYQGHEYDVIGFEEATTFTDSQRILITNCARNTRTDFKPRLYFTANPGGVGHGWFKRLFVDRQYQGAEKAEDYVFIQATVYDNEALMRNNPEYIDTLKNLPEDLRKALLDGDWDVLAGQYFKEFRKDIHVVRAFEIPKWWKRVRSLDYGQDMTACYWWAIAPDGRCFAYRELYEPGLNLSNAAKKILSMTPKSEEIEYTVASPDLWSRRQETGLSGTEIMSNNGLYGLRRANNSRIPGWRVMRVYLEPYKDEQDILVAKLAITEDCPNLARCIPQLLHDENNPEDVSDSPHEISHGPESCRYFLMSRAPLSIDSRLDFPDDMPEIEKSRAISNIQFEDKYRELMKHKFKAANRRW